jgi:hypothetical protein
VPLKAVNFSQSNSAAAVDGVDMVRLNFQADVAEINLIPTSLSGELVRVDVSASGSMGLFGSADRPVQFSFSNQTSEGTLTVSSKVTREDMWPFSFNLQVICDVYVDRSVVLDVTVQTTVGTVTLDTDQSPVTFKELNLRSTTGRMQTTLSSGTVLDGDVSVSSTTGSINFLFNGQVVRKTAINLGTTTGAINVGISQAGTLGGDVSLDVTTTTGSIDCAVTVGDNVGSQIISQTSTGSISVDAQNFIGDKSPISSTNYPAADNINVNLATTTGSIHVLATYIHGSPAVTEQEQVHNEIINFIHTNHPDMVQFTSLSWGGGKEDTGLLGAEKYVYYTLTGELGSAGLTVTLEYPVVPNPVYTVTANYNTSGVFSTTSIVWQGTWQNGTIVETSYNSGSPSTQEQARDDVMVYIQNNHNEIAQFVQDLNWKGGRVETDGIVSEIYTYTTIEPGVLGGAGWTVNMAYKVYPVIPNPVYTVRAKYSQAGVLSTYMVAWEGTWQNGTVTETSCVDNVPTRQEQVRDSVMAYIENKHNETGQFMVNLNWTGGRVDRGLIVGAELYVYISGGWNVTMTYPVVPNPLYRVTADYQAPGTAIPYRVIWTGTWHDDVITEDSYEFAQ